MYKMPSNTNIIVSDMYPNLKKIDVRKERSGGLTKSEYPNSFPAKRRAFERKSYVSQPGPK
jgi:hypothetical protein